MHASAFAGKKRQLDQPWQVPFIKTNMKDNIKGKQLLTSKAFSSSYMNFGSFLINSFRSAPASALLICERVKWYITFEQQKESWFAA